MTTYSIHQTRANFLDVIDFVKNNQGRVTITRYGKPVAEIVPVSKESRLPVESHRDLSSAATAQGSRVRT